MRSVDSKKKAEPSRKRESNPSLMAPAGSLADGISGDTRAAGPDF